MILMTEREILESVFGGHAVDRLVAHAPYDQVDSSDVLTALNRDGRCALSVLADGADFTVTIAPTTEPVVRMVVGRHPALIPCANDVARAMRDLVVANDGGRFRTPGGVEVFLDRWVDVSERFARFARDRQG